MRVLFLVALVAIFGLISSVRASDAQNYLAELEGPACPLCTVLVSKVKDVIQDYDGKITDEFKQRVCGKLPSTLQGVCGHFVEEYGPKVIENLLKKVEPKKICEKVGLCKDSVWFRKYVTDTEAYFIYMELIDMGENTDACPICKYVVSMVSDYVNKSREELEMQLLKACKFLPGAVEQLCDTVVLLYGPQIVDAILEFGTPERVCAAIKLCPEEKPEPVLPVIEENSVQCELCKYVINLAKDYIRGNETEAKIREALHKVCDAFPPISKQCEAFVDLYEPLIIEFILQKIPTEESCINIGLCTKEVAVNVEGCPLCKFVVGIILDQLESGKTIDFIKEKVTQLCGFLPGEYSQVCKFVADQYVEQIIRFLEQKMSPDFVCQAVGLCPKSVEYFAYQAANPQFGL